MVLAPPPMPQGPITATPVLTGVDDLLAQTPPMPSSEEEEDAEDRSESLDNLRLGAEAQDNISVTSSSQSESASRVIGGIHIAEYEGSPRRYRPRGGADPKSSRGAAKQRTGGGAGAARLLPGFPQRVLPAEAATAAPAAEASTASSSNSSGLGEVCSNGQAQQPPRRPHAKKKKPKGQIALNDIVTIKHGSSMWHSPSWIRLIHRESPILSLRSQS